jgi:hypothetical protein
MEEGGRPVESKPALKPAVEEKTSERLKWPK